MKQYITPDRIANSIMMLQNRYRGSFLILEGSDDAKVFRNLIDINNCRIEIAYGKPNVVQVIKELNRRRAKGVLAIVDADYWIIEGNNGGQENLLTTTDPNLEVMLLLSPALEKVITEVLPGDKIEYAQIIANRVREVLPSIGLRIGCLRLVNLREKLHIDFDPMPIERFLDTNTLEVNVVTMIKSITVTHKNLKLTESDLHNRIADLLAQAQESWLMCQGHDLITSLSIILPKIISKAAGHDAARYATGKARPDRLSENLRLAYERTYFARTELYSAIAMWENRNQPYIILAK